MMRILGCYRLRPFYACRSRSDGYFDLLMFDPDGKLRPSTEKFLGWRRVHPMYVRLLDATSN